MLQRPGQLPSPPSQSEIISSPARTAGRPGGRGPDVLRAGGAILLILSLLLPGSLTARQEDVNTSFRVEGQTVLVDAVVYDDDNRIVSDLKAEDFILLEDGVEQTLDFFRLIRPETAAMSAAAYGPGAADPSTATDSADDFSRPEAEARNLIVFLLDYATTEFTNQKLVQDAAVKYVEKNLRAHDYAAVFGLGAGFALLQEFTNDREKLIQALRIRELSGKALSSLTQAGPPVDSRAFETVSNAGLASVSAASPQAMGAAGTAIGASRSELAQLAFAIRIQRMFYNMQSFVGEREARGVLTAIQAIARGLEGVEGRKTLILFSQGFVIGPHLERTLEKTVSMANRANLAIYAVDSQGLATGNLSNQAVPANELSSISATSGGGTALTGRRIDAQGGLSLFDRAKQVGSDLRDSALRYVSTATGGFAIRNTNDLYLGLERVDQDIRSYYLLGYRPSNQEFDGQFRQIEVRVRKPKLLVRHRTGYISLPSGLEMLTADEYRILQEAQHSRSDRPLPAFFRLAVFPTERAEQDVLLSLEIPGSAVKFEQEKTENGSSFNASLLVIGLVRDQSGAVSFRFGTPMDLQLKPDEHLAVQQGGLSFNNRMMLFPGDYAFELLIQDRNSGRTALMERSLRLDPPSSGLHLSSIILGKEVKKAEPGSEALTVGETTVIPSASSRFQNGDRLVFYFEIFGPDQERLSGSDLQVQVEVNPSGSPSPIRLPAFTVDATQPGESGGVAFSRYIELEGLPPGPYFLTARVTDPTAGTSVEKRTDFQIIER